jgi:hypothetical protein
LKDKVLKSVLLLDVDDTFSNEVGKAYYECIRAVMIIETIIKLSGSSKLVYDLINENYSKALKYNFYDILSKHSYYMIGYYSLIGNKKLLLVQETNFNKFFELDKKEKLAKSLYNKISVNFQGNDAITNDLLNKTKKSLDLLFQFRFEVNSADVDFHYFYLAFIYYRFINDIDNLLKICLKAQDLLVNNSLYVTYTRNFAILYYKSIAFLNTKRYDEGFNLLNKSTNDVPKSNYNWFLLEEIRFKLLLNNNCTKDSLSIYFKVINNNSFNRQSNQLKEKWKIYHAYLIFMDNYLNNGNYKFNQTKFFNEVPYNSKDKSGFNFAIRVIEIFFYAARKQYNLVFAKMEGLRVYRSRYLNDNTYKRNHLFLSLLLKAEKSGFDSKIMKEADWKEVELLKGRNNFIADWEIIPYETLWDIFVELA